MTGRGRHQSLAGRAEDDAVAVVVLAVVQVVALAFVTADSQVSLKTPAAIAHVIAKI